MAAITFFSTGSSRVGSMPLLIDREAMPSNSLPIFDGGANAANLKVAKVDREVALAQ